MNKKRRYDFTKDYRVNRKYKDHLFRYIFKDKKELLQLYNALNGSDYRDAGKLRINTMGDVIYLGMKNDLSFLIGDMLNLYEHQSSVNPNMPLRGLLYFAGVYSGYLEEIRADIYGSVQVKLPLPRYIVFYNGTGEEPDERELLLSDAFLLPERRDDACLECRVLMMNINLGHNRRLMEKCRRLEEYARFVKEIRDRLSLGMPLREAVDSAVEFCIRQGVLEDILRKDRAEVVNLILTEYNEKQHLANVKKEGYEDGLEKGKGLGRIEGVQYALLQLLKIRGSLTPEIEQEIRQEKDEKILTDWLTRADEPPAVDKSE